MTAMVFACSCALSSITAYLLVKPPRGLAWSLEPREKDNMKDNNKELPPPTASMQIITGFWVSSAIYVAAKLGLADHIGDNSIDTDELALRVGAHSGALYRLLRALSSVGVFTEVGPRRFALTPIGNCLKSGIPGSLRAFSIVGREIGWKPWGQLFHSVRTGETAFDHLHGMGYFEFLKQNPGLSRLFDEAIDWLRYDERSCGRRCVRFYAFFYDC